MPTISAACHHVIFLAAARKITSCTFIARSVAAFVEDSIALHGLLLSASAKRTYHVLIRPDISCASHTLFEQLFEECPQLFEELMRAQFCCIVRFASF